MSCLSLMVLLLAVWLSAANSSPFKDKTQLENLVSEILNRYRPSYKIGNEKKSPVFSLTVSIPFDQKTDKFDISQVHDDVNRVKETMINCEVYTGNKVVGATVLRWPDVVNQCPHGLVQWPLSGDLKSAKTWADVYTRNPSAFHDGRADHAEYRTLQKLNTLSNSHNQDDLLLIYVFASPCAHKCANTNHKANILDLLRVYKKYKVVFVFSKVFKPRNSGSIPEEQLHDALENLGAVIGLERIFRCDTLKGQMCCMSCDVKGNVAQWCYQDNQHGCYNVKG